MTEIDYLERLRSKLDRLEKIFCTSFDLVRSTQECLSRAKENFSLHENILEGSQYIPGVDSPEIESVIKISRVGVRYYGRQIEKLEKDLQDYRETKNQAEAEWKRLNSQLMRRSIKLSFLTLGLSCFKIASKRNALTKNGPKMK